MPDDPTPAHDATDRPRQDAGDEQPPTAMVIAGQSFPTR